MAALVVGELTGETLAGTGVFDVLMRSVKAHLNSEFTLGRIKGPEYSTIYLGSMELAMRSSLDFVFQMRKNDVEAQLLIKQGLLLDAQVLLAQAQIEIAAAEIEIKAQQVLVAQAEVGIAQAKLVNIPKEGAQLDAQTLLIGQQRTNLISENLGIVAKTALTTQQVANALLENLVLDAQECKLRAEFDLITAQTQKSAEELALLAQKTATEKAQITALGVDADSVIGRQKGLYAAQTSGFTRDAEQKAAKLLVDTWSVRRTTDEATVATDTGLNPNFLGDASVGRAITKLLQGVGA